MWYNFYVNNRDYKNFSCGEVYHIYNRGVNKDDIFRNQDDYQLFLFRLKENLFPNLIKTERLSKIKNRRKMLPPNSFDLICFCLMPNHFHLLIQQKTDLPITKLISKICTSYSMIFNKKYERVGAVFQDQFKSVRIENNEQLLWTSYYIHKNPIESGLVENLQGYRWSSFSEYFNSFNKWTMCKKDIITKQFHTEDMYLKYFSDKEKGAPGDLKNLFFDFDEN